jgi:hypothetical protein
MPVLRPDSVRNEKPAPQRDGSDFPWCHPSSSSAEADNLLSGTEAGSLNALGFDNGALSGQAYNRDVRLRLAAPRSIHPPRKRRALTCPGSLRPRLGNYSSCSQPLAYLLWVQYSGRAAMGVKEGCVWADEPSLRVLFAFHSHTLPRPDARWLAIIPWYQGAYFPLHGSELLDFFRHSTLEKSKLRHHALTSRGFWNPPYHYRLAYRGLWFLSNP